ncbi:MAG: helix-turn-helix domain-containing protein [Bryobacteraceae bacterium]
MSSVGEKLRSARVQQGLDIGDLAAHTKISARFLEAIESDRRDQLPGGFFFKHWAVQYAHALSVDQAEIQDGIDRVLNAEAPLPLPGQVQATSKHLPLANRDSVQRDGTARMALSFALLVMVVLGCSGFYAWWHKQQQSSAMAGVPAAGMTAQPERVIVAERAPEEAAAVPVSQPVADRPAHKKAAVAGHIAKHRSDLRRRSRRRVRARGWKRPSSPELRSE